MFRRFDINDQIKLSITVTTFSKVSNSNSSGTHGFLAHGGSSLLMQPLAQHIQFFSLTNINPR